jgi:hypothetical protein
MMGDFQTQMQAVDVAGAVMTELFNPDNQAETDRAVDIRVAREAELAPKEPTGAEPLLDAAPTRRALITAGMSDDVKEES